MRRLLASLSTVALLAPLTASAAPTPSELIQRVSSWSTPVTSMEIHGHVGDTYIAVWAKGSQKGKLTEPAVKSTFTMTMDVVQGEFKTRAKGQARMIDNMLYLRLDSLEGNLGGLLSFNLLQNTWIKIPLDEWMTMTEIPMPDTIFNDPTLLQTLNDYFMVTEERFPGGKTYTMTLSDDARALIGAQGATLDVTVRANTNADGTPVFASLDITLADPTSDMQWTATSKTQNNGGNVYVEVPKDALTWEEFEAKLENMFGAGGFMPALPDFLTPMEGSGMTDDEWALPDGGVKADGYWEEQWNTSNEDADDVDAPTWIDGCMAEPGTPAYVLEIRRGLCNPNGLGRGRVLRNR